MNYKDNQNISKLYEMTEKRYKVWLGDVDSGISEKVYIGANSPEEALKYAIEKLKDMNLKWTHNFVQQVEWPKNGYLKSVED
jgi:hypothetical protein